MGPEVWLATGLVLTDLFCIVIPVVSAIICCHVSASYPPSLARPLHCSKPETAEEAAERIKREAEQARDSVKEALQAGLGQKRKQPEGGGGSGGPAAKSGAGGSSGGPARRGVLDSMLGDISSDSEDEEEEQAE